MSKILHFDLLKPNIYQALTDTLFPTTLNISGYRENVGCLSERIEKSASDFGFNLSIASDKTYGFLGVLQAISRKQIETNSYYSQLLASQLPIYVTVKAAALYRKSRHRNYRVKYGKMAEDGYKQFMETSAYFRKFPFNTAQQFVDIEVSTRFYALTQLWGSKFGESALKDQLIAVFRDVSKNDRDLFMKTLCELSESAKPELTPLLQDIYGDCLTNAKLIAPIHAMQICFKMVETNSPFFRDVSLVMLPSLCTEAAKDYDRNPATKAAYDSMMEICNQSPALKTTGQAPQSSQTIDFSGPLRPQFCRHDETTQNYVLVH